MSEKTAEVPVFCPICMGVVKPTDRGWYYCEKCNRFLTFAVRESAPETVKLVVCNEPENCGLVKELEATLREAQRRLEAVVKIINSKCPCSGKDEMACKGCVYHYLKEAAEGRAET